MQALDSDSIIREFDAIKKEIEWLNESVAKIDTRVNSMVSDVANHSGRMRDLERIQDDIREIRKSIDQLSAHLMSANMSNSNKEQSTHVNMGNNQTTWIVVIVTVLIMALAWLGWSLRDRQLQVPQEQPAVEVPDDTSSSDASS